MTGDYPKIISSPGWFKRRHKNRKNESRAKGQNVLLFNYFTESLVPFVFKALFCILYFWGVGGGVGMQLLLVIGSDSYSDGGKNVA